MTAALARTLAVMDAAASNKPSASYSEQADMRTLRPARRKRASIGIVSPLARPLAIFPFFRP
jgi:hypothetical protein